MPYLKSRNSMFSSDEEQGKNINWMGYLKNSAIGGREEVRRPISFMAYAQQHEFGREDALKGAEDMFSGVVQQIFDAYCIPKIDANAISAELLKAKDIWENNPDASVELNLSKYQLGLLRSAVFDLYEKNNEFAIIGIASMERTIGYFTNVEEMSYLYQKQANTELAEARAMAGIEGIQALFRLFGLDYSHKRFIVRGMAVDTDVNQMHAFLSGEIEISNDGRQIQLNKNERVQANFLLQQLDKYVEVRERGGKFKVYVPDENENIFDEQFLSAYKETGQNPYLDRMRGTYVTMQISPELMISTAEIIKGGGLDFDAPVGISLKFSGSQLDVTSKEHEKNTNIIAWLEDESGKFAGQVQVLRPEGEGEMARMVATLPGFGNYVIVAKAQYLDAQGEVHFQTGEVRVLIGGEEQMQGENKEKRYIKIEKPMPPQSLLREISIDSPIEGVGISINPAFGGRDEMLNNAQLSLVRGIIMEGLTGKKDKSAGKEFLKNFSLSNLQLPASQKNKITNLFNKGEFSQALKMMEGTAEGKTLNALAQMGSATFSQVTILRDASIVVGNSESYRQLSAIKQGWGQDVNTFFYFHNLSLDTRNINILSKTFGWSEEGTYEISKREEKRDEYNIKANALLNFKDFPVVIGAGMGFSEPVKGIDRHNWNLIKQRGAFEQDLFNDMNLTFEMQVPVNGIVPLNLDGAYISYGRGMQALPKEELGYYVGVENKQAPRFNYGVGLSTNDYYGLALGWRYREENNNVQNGVLFLFSPISMLEKMGIDFNRTRRFDLSAKLNARTGQMDAYGVDIGIMPTENIEIRMGANLFLNTSVFGETEKYSTSAKIGIKIKL